MSSSLFISSNIQTHTSNRSGARGALLQGGGRALLAIAILAAWHVSPSEALTFWSFEGSCTPDSTVSVLGANNSELQSSGIDCNLITLTQLPNARTMVVIAERTITNPSPLEFAGPAIDTQTNKTLTLVPVDSIYPRRGPGASQAEIRALGSTPGDVLRGARGFCFFGDHRIENSKSIACSAFFPTGAFTLKYLINFNASNSEVAQVGGGGGPAQSTSSPNRPPDYDQRASTAVASRIRYVREQEERSFVGRFGGPRDLPVGECMANIPINARGELRGTPKIACDPPGLTPEMREAIRLAAPYSAGRDMRWITVHITAPVTQPGFNG